jgi:hypothetical protein
MTKIKDPLEGTIDKPTGKIKIGRIFVNSNNQQLTVSLSRKKLKGNIPKRIEVLYWS